METSTEGEEYGLKWWRSKQLNRISRKSESSVRTTRYRQVGNDLSYSRQALGHDGFGGEAMVSPAHDCRVLGVSADGGVLNAGCRRMGGIAIMVLGSLQ